MDPDHLICSTVGFCLQLSLISATQQWDGTETADQLFADLRSIHPLINLPSHFYKSSFPWQRSLQVSFCCCLIDRWAGVFYLLWPYLWGRLFWGRMKSCSEAKTPHGGWSRPFSPAALNFQQFEDPAAAALATPRRGPGYMGGLGHVETLSCHTCYFSSTRLQISDRMMECDSFKTTEWFMLLWAGLMQIQSLLFSEVRPGQSRERWRFYSGVWSFCCSSSNWKALSFCCWNSESWWKIFLECQCWTRKKVMFEYILRHSKLSVQNFLLRKTWSNYSNTLREKHKSHHFLQKHQEENPEFTLNVCWRYSAVW